MSFTVSAAEFAATVVKVAALNKRAAKAGIAATVSLTEISRTTRTEKSDLGFDRTYEIVEAELTGLADVKLGDWTVAATLDHGAEGNIFRTNPAFSLTIPEEFRGTDSTRCDHCHTNRLRNQTIVVWSEAEGFKQVGSDCVKLFLGVSANSLIAWFTEASGICEDEGGSWGGADSTVSEFIACAAVVTEFYGFKARSSGYGPYTSDITESALRNDKFFRTNYPDLSALLDSNEGSVIERANKLAAEAREWILNEQSNGSDYILNLKIAAKREAVGRNAGLLASLPNAYKRHMGVVAERAAKAAAQDALPASEFLGAEGAKVTVKATPVYTNRSEGYAYNSPESLFVILLGEGGQKVYMNTTVETVIGQTLEDAERGTFFTVTGTIKALKVSDKGENITVLTRCKAQEV